MVTIGILVALAIDNFQIDYWTEINEYLRHSVVETLNIRKN